MRKIEDIKKDLTKARSEYQSKANSLPAPKAAALSDKVKDLQSELSATISKGGQVCEDCGNKPMGMEQSAAINRRAVTLYEVGCPVCMNKRAQGFTPEEAVSQWNNNEYLPPSKK